MDSSVAGELQRLSREQSILEHQRMLPALWRTALCQLSTERSKNSQSMRWVMVALRTVPRFSCQNYGDTYPNGISCLMVAL